jgi:type IX secretion system PorP/SprF family membrane protein
MRKILPLIAFLLIAAAGFSQHDPQYSMNMYNYQIINPGYCGSNDAICANALYRNQWMGFEGAPTTYLVAANMDIKSISSGAGVTFYSDKLGFETNNGMKLAYCYRIKLGDKTNPGSLGIGLAFGFLNKSLDGDWITPTYLDNPTANDPYEDPAIPHSESKMAFDVDFGAFYKQAFNKNDLLVAGISTTHLNQAQFKFNDLSKMPFLRRHYYITASYYKQLPWPEWELRPSVFVKADGATAQFDINLQAIYKRQFWGGVSYRIGDAFVAMAGYTFPNNLGFGLAYDITTSDIARYSSGSFEVMLRYCFTIEKTTSKTRGSSVRFL